MLGFYSIFNVGTFQPAYFFTNRLRAVHVLILVALCEGWGWGNNASLKLHDCMQGST